MADITPVVKHLSLNDEAVQSINWLLLSQASPNGTPIPAYAYADKTVSIDGTFGASGSITLQGSNDGTNWFPITKPAGGAITFTAAGGAACIENPAFMRPTVTVSDGTTALNCRLVVRRNNPMRT